MYFLKKSAIQKIEFSYIKESFKRKNVSNKRMF